MIEEEYYGNAAHENAGCAERGDSVSMKEENSFVTYLPEDRVIYEKLLRTVFRERAAAKTIGDLLLYVGTHFLGAPYATDTLETEGEESLVINLREFDCVTFVENSLVIAGIIKSGETSFAHYACRLKMVRYRNGVLKGYPSRLHYFTDWLYDNGKKGVVKEVTGEIGGKEVHKEIDFMTGHPEKYPGLRAAESYRKMRAVEKRLSLRPYFLLPKTEVRDSEEMIQNGDIIAITARREGLDVLHVGLAHRIGKRMHLLHASETEGKVVVSRTTLHEYLRRSTARSGIMVARAL